MIAEKIENGGSINPAWVKSYVYFVIEDEMNKDLHAKITVALDQLSPDMQSAGSECVQHLSALGVNDLEDLLLIVQDRASATQTRINACWILGRLRDEYAAGPLLSAFNDDEITVTWEAAKSLGAIGDSSTVEPLISAIVSGQANEKRKAAAHALALIGDKRATQPLVKILLERSEEPGLRVQAAEALGLLQDDAAHDALIHCLTDASVEVRFWATYALGQIGNARSLPALQLATGDHALLPGWWTIGEEAKSAIQFIESRQRENDET